MNKRHFVWNGGVRGGPPGEVYMVHVGGYGLVLEGDGVLVDHPVPDIVDPVGLDPVQSLRLVGAEIEAHLPLGEAEQGEDEDPTDHPQSGGYYPGVARGLPH